jgi:hypothetical protein
VEEREEEEEEREGRRRRRVKYRFGSIYCEKGEVPIR